MQNAGIIWFFNFLRKCPKPGFGLAIRNLQSAKHFGSLQMSFLQFFKKLWINKIKYFMNFQSCSWTSYIVSYFKPIKYLLFNNNVLVNSISFHFNFHQTNYVCKEWKKELKKSCWLNSISLQLISRLYLCASKSHINQRNTK